MHVSRGLALLVILATASARPLEATSFDEPAIIHGLRAPQRDNSVYGKREPTAEHEHRGLWPNSGAQDLAASKDDERSENSRMYIPPGGIFEGDELPAKDEISAFTSTTAASPTTKFAARADDVGPSSNHPSSFLATATAELSESPSNTSGETKQAATSSDVSVSLQTFVEALGGIFAPSVKETSNNNFSVDNHCFPNGFCIPIQYESLSEALNASCTMQSEACKTAATQSGEQGNLTVSACQAQLGVCTSTIQSSN